MHKMLLKKIKKGKKAPFLLKPLKFSHGLGIVWFQHFVSLLNEQKKKDFKGLKAKISRKMSDIKSKKSKLSSTTFTFFQNCLLRSSENTNL